MVIRLPKLRLPKPECRLRQTPRGCEVWDGVRGQWLKLTPEEWVRRHVLAWLRGCGVQPEQMVQEYPVELNGQPQRADVVVVDRRARPWMLVECKAPEVTLSSQTFDQLVRYNFVLNARYLMITNGMENHLYAFSEGEYRPMTTLPDWCELGNDDGYTTQ